jgi:hypothetical protein
MIASEERTKARFGDGRGNCDDDVGNQGNQNRKRRPNNMVAFANKGKKSSKPRRFQDLENLPCPWHPNSNHTTADCRSFKNYTQKSDNNKGKKKYGNDKPDQEYQGDRGFQKSKGMVNVIFTGVPRTKSKQQEKLALCTISASLPTSPKYLNWSKYPISFSRQDQWTSLDNAGHYPLVLDSTIGGMNVTKVLIDGGSGLNIIFADTLRKIGLDFNGMLTPTDVPFYGIVPGKAAMPLGQITLPVTFGT